MYPYMPRSGRSSIIDSGGRRSGSTVSSRITEPKSSSSEGSGTYLTSFSASSFMNLPISAGEEDTRNFPFSLRWMTFLSTSRKVIVYRKSS